MRADFLIERADLIATCAGPAPRRGAAQADISPLGTATIASWQGRITYVGPASGVTDAITIEPDAVRLDAVGCTVVPGFVDPHTHVLYAGDRRGELQERLGGASYADIAARGGGILATVAATRQASEEALVAATRVRLDEMLACGTTTCEVKSGYGLTTESELRQLRAIRGLDQSHPMDLVATFLGAHAVPREFQQTRSQYVRLVIDDMLPAVADGALAEWCDVFCEHGAFDEEETRAILEAAAAIGLKPRIHADELGQSGGSQVAAALRLRAADHLVHVDEAAADALADADVTAVLLPAASLYLKLGRVAPARMLIDRGVAVALGSDVNPGGGHSPSLPFAMTLACFQMNLTLEEALVAATLNAAWSLDRADSTGSLEVGKLMDAVVVDGPLTELLRVGIPAIRHVVKRGRVVRERRDREGTRREQV